MKKLRLKALSLGAKEILNRDQLKSIYGGFDGSGSDGPGDPAYVGGGCDGTGPVTWICYAHSSYYEIDVSWQCCTRDGGDWQCVDEGYRVCHSAESYACNPYYPV